MEVLYCAVIIYSYFNRWMGIYRPLIPCQAVKAPGVSNEDFGSELWQFFY
jgi:hypothetical protein